MTMDDLQVLILRNHNYFCFLFPDNSQASVMDRDRDIENLSGEHRDAARRVMSSALICPPCDEQRFNLILTGELTFFTPGPMAFAAQVGTELSYAICAISLSAVVPGSCHRDSRHGGPSEQVCIALFYSRVFFVRLTVPCGVTAPRQGYCFGADQPAPRASAAPGYHRPPAP